MIPVTVMIGTLVSIGLSVTYITTAWNGFSDDFQIGPAVISFVVVLAVGIFLFPRTVGIALTPVGLLSPVCFVIAIFRVGLETGIAVLGIGAAALLGTWLIAAVRPDAVGWMP